jgi:hypothetical protein
MNETLTPRTDSHFQEHPCFNDTHITGWRDFARHLERELSTLRSAAEKMAEALDDVSNTLQSRHAYLNKSTRYKVRDSLTTYRNLPKP